MALAMESATLTNPQRRSSVHQPVQKCLSLPSYAKAGGEGIDHRLIFAALEQKEKVRRKSKIFKEKEKSGSRQNYFCLPLTSNGRCKETSLSSDTSCSSVEYQKPKTPAAKTKKNQNQQTRPGTEIALQKSRKSEQPGPATTKKTNGAEISRGSVDCVNLTTAEDKEFPTTFAKNGIPGSDEESGNSRLKIPHPEGRNSLTEKFVKSAPEVANENNSGTRSKVNEDGSLGRQVSKNGDAGKLMKTLDVPRSTVGSSDSLERMERSSRSSNDSLSRRERREALKARVEAEREKYIGSSSDEDVSNARKNKCSNDGTGPRTVREVKTKSLSRAEKNSRRKSQDEQVLNKGHPKSQVSKDKEKTTIAQNAEVKDCNLSSDISLTDVLNDFEKSIQPLPKKQKVNENLQLLPSREFLPYDKETDDAKLRLAAATPVVQNKHYCDVKGRNHLQDISVNSKNLLHRDQIIRKTSIESFSAKSVQHTPAGVSSQAPTPPPRSPKSMIFLNKMFLSQCKNMNASVNSFMKKQSELPFPQSTTSSMKSFDYLQQPEKSQVSKVMEYSLLARRNKESMRSRRKTCSNFPCFDSLQGAKIFGHGSQSVLEDFSTSNPNLSNRLSFGHFTTSMNHCSESNSKFLQARDPERESSRSIAHRNVYRYEPLKVKSTFPYGERLSLEKDFICSSCKLRSRDRNDLTVRSNLCISGEIVETSKCRPVSNDCLETSSLESLDLPNNKPSFASFLKTSDRLSKSEANLLRHVESPGVSTKHIPFIVSPIKPVCEIAITKSRNVQQNNDVLRNNRLRDESLSLDCAMEELQNIYKSLNESDESVSELKQASSMHMNKYYVQNSTPISSSHSKTHSNLHSKLVEPSPLQNSVSTGCNSSESVRVNENVVSENKPQKRIASDNSTQSDHGKTVVPVSSSEPLCIEELFDNLTMQLDFEQKALEESRLKKVSSPCSLSEKDVGNEVPPYRSSSVGLPKATKTMEILDVLDSKDAISVQKEPDAKHRFLPRKKRKAVRSYSANILSLLQPADDAVLSDNVSLQLERPQSASLDFLEPDSFNQRSSRKSDSRDVSVTSEKPVPCHKPDRDTQVTSPRGNVSCVVNADVELKSQNERCLTPNKKSDEIWEIRVSMDSRNKSGDTSAPERKSTADNCNLSLHSAVLQTSKNSKIQQTTASRPTKRPTHVRSFSSVPLDDGELDRLLTSLLSDVSKVIEATTESTLARNSSCDYVRPQEKIMLCATDGRKGTSEDVKATRDPRSSKMDQCLSSQNGGNLEENEAGNLNLHYYSKNLENNSCLLDNDSRKNNNAEISPLQTSTENVVTSGQESCVKYNMEPHPHSLQRSRPAPLPPCKLPLSVTHSDKCGVRNQNIRRHSVGGDDLRTEEFSTRCGSFFTLEKRFQTIAYPVNPPCQSPSWKAVCSSHNNYTSKEIRSSQVCQPSSVNEKGLSAMLTKTSFIEKPKDKSYKRKSSLNRVDFVQTSPSIAGGDSHVKQSLDPRTEFFTSDENECVVNRDASCNVPSFASVKRKNQLAKEPASTEKQAVEGSVKMKAPHFWKMHRGLPRGKNNRALNLEKRSHSAGEQESSMDYNENGYFVNPCLSAQEIDYCREHCHQNLCHIHNTEENYEHIDRGTLPQSLQGRKTAWHLSTASHEVLSASRHIHLSCDTPTSQTESLAVTPRSTDQVNYFSEVTLKHSNLPVHRSEVELIIDSSAKDNSAELENEKIKSCTVENDGIPSDHGTVKGEFDDSVAAICSSIENSLKVDDKNSSSLCCSLREHHSDCEVNKSICKMKFPISHSDPEEQSPEKRGILEMIEITSLSCSEKDLSKQPSSILRRHHHEEKKGLQGILKHPGDEKLTRHPPSILKHRESSEEKDSYHPADLHSILKKSSEDESTHSSNPDIRPILKNSSTEEDSPLNATKPRPILKKRTSFSDEFSYTSLSNELKPILKKKIQIDSSEEQPKPILKTRRKSEESRSTEAMAASLGARPRANSADLNIKPILKNQNTKGSTSASSSSVLINTSDSES